VGFLDTLKATLLPKRKGIIGLDIGTDAILVAVVGQTKQGFVVEKLAWGPMPPEAFQDGEITDPAGVGEVIRGILDDNGIASDRAVVSIGGQSVIIRLINTELMEKDELETFLLTEAERYIPFSPDDVNISSQIVGNSTDDGGNPQLDVLLVAVQTHLVDSYLNAAQEASLSLNCVDVSSFAVMRALENMNYIDDSQSVAVLLVQGPATDIMVISEGAPRFNRSVLIGSGYMLDNLISSLGIDEDAARELWDQIDMEPQGYDELPPHVEQATEIVRPALSELTGEISRSLEFYMNQGGGSIDRIMICGRGATLKGIDRFLASRLGIEVVIANPLSAIDFADEAVDEAQAPAYVTAIGLSMRGLAGT
jgi:type IV pilus assembly protein PilM